MRLWRQFGGVNPNCERICIIGSISGIHLGCGRDFCVMNCIIVYIHNMFKCSSTRRRTIIAEYIEKKSVEEVVSILGRLRKYQLLEKLEKSNSPWQNFYAFYRASLYRHKAVIFTYKTFVRPFLWFPHHESLPISTSTSLHKTYTIDIFHPNFTKWPNIQQLMPSYLAWFRGSQND